MNVGISQSNYIPWLGYFELISRCEKFVLLDTVQYTKNDWRNRNRIVVNGQAIWLTIPVLTQNSKSLRINEIKIADRSWSSKHLKTIVMAYSRYEHFREIRGSLESLYESLSDITYLSQINLRTIQFFCKVLNVSTEVIMLEKQIELEKNQRLIRILNDLESTKYTFTPRSLEYIDKSLFKLNNIQLEKCNFNQTKKILSLEGIVPKTPCSIIDTIARYGVDTLKDLLNRSS